MATTKRGDRTPVPNIAAIRQYIGMSQQEMARKLKVSVETLNRWENGTTLPTRLAIKTIGEILLNGMDR